MNGDRKDNGLVAFIIVAVILAIVWDNTIGRKK